MNILLVPEGITTSLNLTYQATDVGETYDQQLDLIVVASGSTAFTEQIPPVYTPHAAPSGFSNDILSWTATGNSNSIPASISFQRMLMNINLAGTFSEVPLLPSHIQIPIAPTNG